MGLAKTAATRHVPKNIRDVFRPVTELESLTGLKIALWSREKIGKTHLTFGCPVPVYGIDTEGSWDKNKDQFTAEQLKHVHVTQVLYEADKEKGVVDVVQSLEAAIDAMDAVTDYIAANRKIDDALKTTITLQEAFKVSAPDDVQPDEIAAYTTQAQNVLDEMVELGVASVKDGVYTRLKPFPVGTIVLDSGTDIWDWLGIWKDEKNFSEPGRLQWGHANKRYNQFIMMMLHSRWNVVATFKAEAAVSDKGGDLGFDKPKWQKKTGYWFDVIIELQRTANGRVAVFRGDRFGGNLATIENPTYQSIVAQLQSKKKLKVVT